MPLEDVADYVWLGQVCFALLPWRMDMELVRTFRSGKVAYELLRPVELWGFWWARHVALLAAPTMLRCLPVLLVAGPVLGDLGPPASLPAFLAFAAALAGALVLGAAMVTTVSTTLFWTVAGEGAAALHTGLFFLLSGMIVPLPLFPDWSRPVVERLPYAQLVDAPFRLYSGHMAPGEVLGVLGLQAAWLLVLWALGRAVLARGVRRAVIQGG